MGKGRLRMDPKKLQAVLNYPTPQNVTDVRAFLGFTGYYRYFVKNYSAIVRPLLALTRKSTTFHWGKEEQAAFDKIRTIMCQAPVLRQPDFQKKFYLQTDASAYGVGAVLLQEGDTTTPSLAKFKKPVTHPVAFFSAMFTPTERNYDIYEQELLAVMKALAHWRPYLGWTKFPFTIMTDHANLQYWKSPKNLNRRTARWHADLQEYCKGSICIGLGNEPRDLQNATSEREPTSRRAHLDPVCVLTKHVMLFAAPPTRLIDFACHARLASPLPLASCLHRPPFPLVPLVSHSSPSTQALPISRDSPTLAS